jgi:uncharacterized protein YrrD
MDASMPLDTGADLFDKNGSKVGTITDVVFEPATLAPEWYEVKTGMVSGHHYIPVEFVTVEKGRGVVPFDKKVVKTAPHASLPPLDDEKQLLLEHYRAA